MSGATQFPGGDKTMPLAIIGLGGRFPGDASNPDKLWNLLAEKRSARSEIPSNRYSIDGFYHPHAERAGAQNFTTAHFMERDPEAFDAPFFQLPPNEVKAMDPQQRMCLEVAYEALENAGVRIEDIVASQTAVYTGCFTADYKDMMSHDTDNLPAYFPTGVAPSCLSNRVSWFYDLRGPSMTVDTACSSSLIALHLAATAVRGGEATMALVGGVNFMCSPEYNFTMSALHFLTPDGKCQSFDEKGNGYARGEGCSFIVIKPLDQALKDNDTIRAVIRNTGANQDGKTPGITLPSSDAQAALIRNTYARAGLDLSETGYFEAHGTGTAAGDPIETNALGATFGQARPKNKPLWVGSIKANIGHLEGASGLAGLTKALYVLEKGMIPGQVWLDKVNPRVQLDAWNLAIPRELTPWPYEGLRRVSINSFGFGGANAHCILDDAYHYLKLRGLTGKHNTTVGNASSGTTTPSTPGSSNDSAISVNTPFEQIEARDSMTPFQIPLEKFSLSTPKLIALSSHEQSGIARSAELFTDYLKTKLEDVPAGKHAGILSQLAYTLGPRRSVLPWKTFAVAKNLEDVSAAIADAAKPIRSSKAPKVGFVFTGQGAQHYAMGRELWAYPVYAESIQAADAHLANIGCDWSMVEEFWKDKESSRIDQPLYSQPLCTALQVGLVDLLRSWGITPAAVVGHSSGEIAAAYAKGAITKEDAWSISYHRGRLSSSIKDLAPKLKGGMLAAGVSEDAARTYLDKVTEGKASVACINSPVSVTISGDVKAIEQVEEMLKADGMFARKLKVETAYHSFHMEVISQQYLESMASLVPKKDDADAAVMYSSVTGSFIENADLGAQYWVDNMLGTVKFGPAVDQLLSHSKNRSKRQRAGAKPYVDILVELGPAGALQGPLKQILGERKKACQITSGLARGQDCTTSILNLAGFLFQAGYAVDLGALNNTEKRDLQLLVDIPPYAWNHTNKYWCETALAAGYRFRKTPRNDLLGTIDADLNDNEKTWRHHFRLSENPWIEDHSVHNTLLYPAAGMMVMALEAAKEVADLTKVVDGYELRDVVVGKALIVPRDEDGVETKLHLRPWRLGSRTGDASWDEFMIYSRHGKDTWSLNCSGLLRVVYKQGAGNSAFIDELATKNAYHKTRYNEVKLESTTEQTAKSFYDHQRKIGLQLGITFCNLFEINKGDGQSACAVRVPDMAQTMPMKYMTKHTIHPCTLDAIIQTLLPTVEGRYESLKTAAIPTFIQKLFVSADTPSEPGAVFQTYSEAGYTGLTEAEASVFASIEGWSKPLVVFERIRATRLASLTDSPADANKLARLRKIAGEFIWKHDISNMSDKDIIEFCCGEQSSDSVMVLAEEMETAALVYARRAFNICSRNANATIPNHLTQLYTSLQRLVNNSDISIAQEEKTLSDVAKYSPYGELLSKIGKLLPEILQGQAIATEIATQNDLLSKFEATNQGNEAAQTPFAKYLELVAHHNPGMKVLELGCESNAITEVAVNAMVESDDSTPWFQSYTVTGSSAEPATSVAKVIAEHPSHLSYKQIDLSKDLAGQGIKENEYDLILVSNLSQRAPIESVLERAKKTLKAGGKIVFREVMRKAEWYSLIFAALGDGILRPTRTEPEWTNLLADAGFSGIDFKLPDTSTELYTFNVATVPTGVEENIPQDIVLIEADLVTDEAERFYDDLEVALAQHSKVSRTSLKNSQSADLAGKACIVLAELQYPVLFDLSDNDFHTVRKICLEAESTTWLTRGGSYECKNPKMGLITGLARTIRQESLGIKLATLDLDPNTVIDDPVNSEAIIRVLKSHSLEAVDQEYAVRDGVFMTPRVHLNKGANDLIATLNMEQQPEPGHFKQEGRALTLTVGTPGMLDTLYFKDDDTAQQPLQPGEIEMEVKASGLNFMDIMVAMDQIQEPAIGLECSGVVTRTGSAVTRFQQGDRVMTWLLGGFSNYARNDESMFQKIPDSMSFEIAASLPMIYCTAWQSLIQEARLEKDDKVLIHAAAGGVGQAAIMIAQAIGAEIFITVGSQTKRDHVKKLYGIPDDHIFNSRDLSFVDGIKRMTKGEGVDVILNSLAGEALRESWNCLAWFGRFIELGKKDITDNTGLEMGPFLRNQSFHAVNVIGTLRASVPRAAKMFQKTMDFFYGQKCAAVEPVTVMGFDNVEQGFRALQSGKNMGKIVFKAEDTAIVRAIPQKVRDAEFSSEVTYVLSGGLGGLGRSLSQLMVDRGAKNLAFLARSGASKPSAKAQVEALEAQGVRVKVCACDIGNAEHMRKAVEEIQSTMPPIKGVIQAAMSLADAAYTNMTPEQWRLSVNPKAAGTWNLHHHMPKDLDFFVMLASSSGAAGNRGQANYAAGNTFQDAVAHYRRSRGMAAVAIDVGPVLGAGHVAENAELIDSLAAQGYTALREEEFLALIQAGITGITVSGESIPGQLVTGFATGGLVSAEGWEMPYYLEDPKMRHLMLVDVEAGSGESSEGASLSSQIASITSVAAGTDIVTAAMSQKLAKLMMVSPDDIDINKPISTYGVDSLTAVEIRAWSFRELSSDISVFDIMSATPISTLARTIVTRSKVVSKEVIAADA